MQSEKERRKNAAILNPSGRKKPGLLYFLSRSCRMCAVGDAREKRERPSRMRLTLRGGKGKKARISPKGGKKKDWRPAARACRIPLSNHERGRRGFPTPIFGMWRLGCAKLREAGGVGGEVFCQSSLKGTAAPPASLKVPLRGVCCTHRRKRSSASATLS